MVSRVRLIECLEALLDYRGKTPPKALQGIPLLSAKVIKDGRILSDIDQFIAEDYWDTWMIRGFPKKGDVVLTTEAPLGEVAQIDHEKYAPGQRVILLRGKDGQLDNTFLKFLFMSSTVKENLLSFATGTTVQGISRKAFDKFEVEIPSFDEQKAIAAVLSALDDKIELNRRMNETLEAMAKALFKSWFVDFDPVRAKAEGRSPEGLAPELVALFPDAFEDSELGEIPKGWEVKSINNICKVARGASPRPIHDFMRGVMPWFKIADATASKTPFIMKTKEFLKEEGISKSVFLKEGSLILSNSATCGVPNFTGIDGCIHDGWLYFTNYKSINPVFLYHILLMKQEEMIRIADGSVQSNLNTSLVGTLRFPLPIEQDLIRIFSNFTNPIFLKLKNLALESKSIEELRDSLLPKLMSGEIRVREVQSLVEPVL